VEARDEDEPWGLDWRQVILSKPNARRSKNHANKTIHFWTWTIHLAVTLYIRVSYGLKPMAVTEINSCQGRYLQYRPGYPFLLKRYLVGKQCHVAGDVMIPWGYALPLCPISIPIKAVGINIHPKANKSNPCYILHTPPPPTKCSPFQWSMPPSVQLLSMQCNPSFCGPCC
jgi:hypothetical protein